MASLNLDDIVILKSGGPDMRVVGFGLDGKVFCRPIDVREVSLRFDKASEGLVSVIYEFNSAMLTKKQ